jgi:ATP/ADP translocase
MAVKEPPREPRGGAAVLFAVGLMFVLAVAVGISKMAWEPSQKASYFQTAKEMLGIRSD